MKKILVGLVIILTVVLTGCTTGNDSKVLLKENHIGWNREIESDGSYSTYELMTPRGLELVAGTTNLNNSIDKYIKYDVFGKEISDLDISQKKRFNVKF